MKMIFRKRIAASGPSRVQVGTKLGLSRNKIWLARQGDRFLSRVLEGHGDRILTM